MNISLKGWISDIKDGLTELTVGEDQKQNINQAIGFLEDTNNLFAGLKDAKTDEEKLEWVNNIKELLCVEELSYIKSDRTLLKKK